MAVGGGGHEVSPGRGGTRHGRPQFWNPHSVASREPYCQTIIRPGIPDGPDIIPGLMRSRADVIGHGQENARTPRFDSLSPFSADICDHLPRRVFWTLPNPCRLPQFRDRAAFPLFFAGVALIMLGPVWYVVQIRLKNLGPAWYVPILSTAGVMLLIASVWRRRGIVRTVFLMLFAIVCGFEWYVFSVAARSPAYAGPAQPGRKVPQFAARLADGTPFTSAELERGAWAVLVFYRGHW